MFSNLNPFIRVVPVVFCKHVFSLCNVKNDCSLVYVVTERVNKMVINVNMFGKASELYSLMLLNASVRLSAAFNRKSFLYHNTVRSKSNCAPGILKQERYPVFEKSITKYFELSILCEEQ